MRTCSRCGSTKESTEFRKTNGWCISCAREDNRSRYHRNKGTEAGEAHRLSARKSWLKKAYGLTLEEYDTMFDSQKGRCAICSDIIFKHGSIESKNNVAHVDHCHDSGSVRGLLCGTCNSALGKFGDKVAVLRAAITYLEKYNV
ncbi:hypothetical protein OCLPNDPH_00020 [Escherichia phage Zappy]|uniref:Endonuclease VII n=1 Tax=Escherichia phage Zappy TaxID=3056228 RepID=A0AA50F133_9CAUD|nr:hypothetical protein OCLPNDPH_00020 [Escherichia phage Zappy]